VDNAEAVTNLYQTPNQQMITLVVSEKDKALRVETEQKELKEAV